MRFSGRLDTEVRGQVDRVRRSAPQDLARIARAAEAVPDLISQLGLGPFVTGHRTPAGRCRIWLFIDQAASLPWAAGRVSTLRCGPRRPGPYLSGGPPKEAGPDGSS